METKTPRILSGMCFNFVRCFADFNLYPNNEMALSLYVDQETIESTQIAEKHLHHSSKTIDMSTEDDPDMARYIKSISYDEEGLLQKIVLVKDGSIDLKKDQAILSDQKIYVLRASRLLSSQEFVACLTFIYQWFTMVHQLSLS